MKNLKRISKRYTKTEQLYNGSSLITKLPGRVYFECCSCGLTHLFLYDITDEKLKITVYLDDVLTEKNSPKNKKRLKLK